MRTVIPRDGQAYGYSKNVQAQKLDMLDRKSITIEQPPYGVYPNDTSNLSQFLADTSPKKLYDTQSIGTLNLSTTFKKKEIPSFLYKLLNDPKGNILLKDTIQLFISKEVDQR